MCRRVEMVPVGCGATEFVVSCACVADELRRLLIAVGEFQTLKLLGDFPASALITMTGVSTLSLYLIGAL